MGLRVEWKTKCDQCFAFVRTVADLNQKTREMFDVEARERVYQYLEIWSPGIPNGWVVAQEKKGYFFFCCRKCYERWLKKNGRKAEIVDLDSRLS